MHNNEEAKRTGDPELVISRQKSRKNIRGGFLRPPLHIDKWRKYGQKKRDTAVMGAEFVDLPMIPLGLSVFPNMVLHFDIGREVNQCPREGHD